MECRYHRGIYPVTDENDLEIVEIDFQQKYCRRISKGKYWGCPYCGETDIDEDANPRSYICGYSSKGSVEASRFIAECQHRVTVDPEVRRLHRKAMIWKWSAPLVYAALILLLLWWAN